MFIEVGNVNSQQKLKNYLARILKVSKFSSSLGGFDFICNFK